MAWAWLAAGAAALAVWLGLRPPVRGRHLEEPPTSRRGRRLVVVGGALLGAIVLGRWAALLVVVVVVSATARHLVRRGTGRRRATAVQLQVAEGCQVLASQLQVGRAPTAALTVAAEDCPALQSVVATDAVGGDVASALRVAAARPGAESLRELASAWELSARTGAPVADLVQRVARQVGEGERLRQLVAAELAAPRASGKVLALLPVFGLAMATTVGADPGGFLLRTWFGQLCLGAAICLTCLGLVWTERLADRALELDGSAAEVGS